MRRVACKILLFVSVVANPLFGIGATPLLPAARAQAPQAGQPASRPPDQAIAQQPGASRPGATTFTPAQRAEIVAVIRDALRQDPSILREAVAALQADDNARSQAESRAALAASRGSLISTADPVAGNPNGDVTIVEFFDTRCPYCKKLDPVMTQLLAKDRAVRLVYKDLPILGPASVLGSKALLAAQKQNGYEKMREAVMQLPPDTSRAMLQAVAEKLGLDWPRLAHDMDDPAIQQRIEANLKLARTLAIQGTPALVIGDEIVPGAVDLAELQRVVAEVRRTRG